MGDQFVVKDSGERKVFGSGMQRDLDTGKVKWHLTASGPMLNRWAIHLTKGAIKYDDNNWMKASGEEELSRFRASAFRHFMQWYNGDRDEDHAAAVYFNINGAEYVRDRMIVAPSSEQLPVTVTAVYDDRVDTIRTNVPVVKAKSLGEAAMQYDDWSTALIRLRELVNKYDRNKALHCDSNTSSKNLLDIEQAVNELHAAEVRSWKR